MTTDQAVRDAKARWARRRRRLIGYGQWQPFTDAEPVRQHVRALGEFGIGWMRLARLAGVSTGGVSKLLYGDPQRGLAPTRRVRPETALKLLAVEPVLDNLGDRTVIDGTGTRRRLQALVYAGWTQSELARRMHADRGNFAKTIVSDLVEVGTHKTAVALYDQLWRTDPVEAGIPAHRAEAARQIAATRGWAPIGAWDDDRIDDPQAYPDWTGWCGTPRGGAIHYRIKIPVCQPCRNAAAQTAAA